MTYPRQDKGLERTLRRRGMPRRSIYHSIFFPSRLFALVVFAILASNERICAGNLDSDFISHHPALKGKEHGVLKPDPRERKTLEATDSTLKTGKSDSTNPTLASPPNEYLTDWISVASFPDKEKRRLIQDTIKALFKTLFDSKKWITITDAESLNTRWQNDKETFNWQWLDEFFRKEKAYREAFVVFRQRRQAREEDEGRIGDLQKEIENLNDNVTFLKARSDGLRGWNAKQEKDFEARLANIPMSVCVFGRIGVESGELGDSLKQYVLGEARRIAIGDIKGIKIKTLTLVKMDSIMRKLTANIEEGRTQISDTYESGNVTAQGDWVLDQILRIEVYPFDRGSQNLNRLQPAKLSQSHHPQLVVVDADTLSNDSSSHWIEFARSHDLQEGQKKFILSQLQIVRTSNRQVGDRIDELKRSYDEEKAMTDRQIAELVERVRAVRSEMDHKYQTMDSCKVELQSLTDQENQSEAIYREARKQYESFYHEKEGYVNKFEQTKIDLSKGSPGSFFVIMAENTYTVLRELKSNLSTTAILTESKGESTKLSIMDQKTLEYKADIVKFRVLYLTFQKVGDDLNGLLNIAYQVRWTPKRTPFTIIGDSLLDVDNKKIWVRLGSETSANYFDDKTIPTGFRKPSLDDLVKLSQSVQVHFVNMEQEIFDQMHWNKDYPYISDDDTNEHGRKLFKGFDFREMKTINLSSVDAVNVLIVADRDVDER